MRRRARLIVLVVVGLVVVVLAGGYAVLALTGDDAPPPPELSKTAAAPTTSAPGRERLTPAAGSFVGYRVNEEYLGVGVRTAVGRTRAVSGTVTVDGARIQTADLRADLRQLKSDQSRRDETLGYRGIETDRYPTSRFTLSAPVAVAAKARTVAGVLELHGRRAPITVTVRGQRLSGGRFELVGSAPIAFARFAIEPPSVAGIVSVRDRGVLEFRLVMAPAGR